MTGPSRDELDRLPWFHTIEFPNAMRSHGDKTHDWLAREAAAVFAPISVRDKTVLDLGAWNGYFSVKATQLGARRLLAIDSVVWNGDPRTYEAFKLVKRFLMPDCEVLNIDAHRLTRELVGEFDVVLCLGVLYHLKHPLFVLERLSEITREWLVVETHLDAPLETRPAAIFYPGGEINNDSSNWWGPNRLCVEAWLRTVGFSEISFTPHFGFPNERGFFHARK